VFTFQGIPEVLKNTVVEQYKCFDFKVLDSDGRSYECYFGLCRSSLFIKTGTFWAEPTAKM